jgi:cobalt/nickel transport system permease protein
MTRSFDLFSDYFARRDNALRRLDARLKLAVALACLVAILSSSRPALPALAFLLSLGTLIILGVPLKLLGQRLLPPLGLVLALFTLQAFLIGSTPMFSISVAGWELVAKREGMLQGALVGSRVLGAVGVLLLLSCVTPAYAIFRTLRWCRVPKEWVEIALLMYRYIFVFLDDASDMVTAQRVRLGYGGFRRSLSSMGALMGGLIVRSLEQSLLTHEAMVARGYAGEFPFGPMPAMRRSERWWLLMALLGIMGVYLALEGRFS